jgi:hypothetical protein
MVGARGALVGPAGGAPGGTAACRHPFGMDWLSVAHTQRYGRLESEM